MGTLLLKLLLLALSLVLAIVIGAGAIFGSLFLGVISEGEGFSFGMPFLAYAVAIAVAASVAAVWWNSRWPWRVLALLDFLPLLGFGLVRSQI